MRKHGDGRCFVLCTKLIANYSHSAYTLTRRGYAVQIYKLYEILPEGKRRPAFNSLALRTTVFVYKGRDIYSLLNASYHHHRHINEPQCLIHFLTSHAAITGQRTAEYICFRIKWKAPRLEASHFEDNGRGSTKTQHTHTHTTYTWISFAPAANRDN